MNWLARYRGLALLLSLLMTKGSSSSSSSATATKASTSSIMEREKERVDLDTPDTDDVIIRFFFIRHSETLSNGQNLVLGQTDSPLTEMGKRQARALGRADIICNEDFWRCYVSDLPRAQTTARLVLGEKDPAGALERLTPEPLLREVAKGAREGYPKTISYIQAEERFRQEHPNEPFPLLETEDECYARIQQWMFQVVGDAIRESVQADGNAKTKKVYCVFALTHSGTLRATIGRLVKDQLPPEIDLTPVGRDGATFKSMKVPNTSVTIIDVVPHNIKDEVWDAERTSQVPPNPSEFWRANLKTFTWTGHYQNV